MTPHIVEAYGQAYLTAIGMGAHLQRDRRVVAIEPDDVRPEPVTLRIRFRQWLSQAVERRRTGTAQLDVYLQGWIGL